MIYLGTASLSGKPSEPISLTQSLIAVLGGIFLLIGLWTPIMGTLLAVDELWIALSLYLSHRAGIVIPIFFAVLSGSIAMLGPGAWSIDARLFGRKRLYSDRGKDRRPSPPKGS